MSFDRSRVCGIVVPMITPLMESEDLDIHSLEKMISHFLDGGVHGIFVNSTTGEGVCLTDENRKRVLKHTVQAVKARIPVYANISDNSVRRAITSLHEAESLGADIAVAHPPFYYASNGQDEVFDYFMAIAEAASIPLMLYNIPSTTKTFISLDTVRRLIQNDRIIGIKDSSVDFVFLQNLIELKKERADFRIFIGKSNLWAAGILSGADGGLDGISNLIPGKCVELYNRIITKAEGVYELQREINSIWKVYECRSFLGGIKGAMSLIGLCKPVTSRPILRASEQEMKRIREILEKWDLLD